MVTLTARRGADQEGAVGHLTAALAGALLPLLDAPPAPNPSGPTAGIALLAEVATAMAADVQWRPGGGLLMAGPDGVGRDVPADRVRRSRRSWAANSHAGEPARLVRAAGGRAAAPGRRGRPGRITDTWVPGSAPARRGRAGPRHDEVEAEVAGIFSDPAELARVAGLDVRLEDGRLVWTTEAGRDFEIEDWAVVPAYEAGPPTVVGGVVRRPTAAATWTWRGARSGSGCPTGRGCRSSAATCPGRTRCGSATCSAPSPTS